MIPSDDKWLKEISRNSFRNRGLFCLVDSYKEIRVIEPKDGRKNFEKHKKTIKIIVMAVLFIMSICLFVGCVKEDYVYVFHFYVDGDNGALKIETTSSFNQRVRLCSDDENLHELECVGGSQYVKLLDWKGGSRELTFIATPNEGYQVKKWLFTDKLLREIKPIPTRQKFHMSIIIME